MKIGVLSDTHGLTSAAVQAVNQLGAIDALVHTGDHYSDALLLGSLFKIPVYAVRGNCDPHSNGQEDLTITIGGYKIFITHGHLYQVKSTLQPLFYRAQELGANIVIFGHTHIPLVTSENNILLFNPGSTTRPQPGYKATFGLINITPQGVTGETFGL
ncbi:metallophosphoesterase [Desulfotruncus alcoholivorax]|uniref:metallophosphoesterase n=1 Tax=Desulfotruncus alcoholivorax TaxID=265477 RepID=UPI00040624B3|nr:metallophosphoesterase [Desulfotruncus alcoholivorax]